MSKYDVKQEVTDKYSLRGRVFHKLREDILSGKYEEHEELKEVAIGEELGVSRTPVREAFRQLELEGLIQIVPNKGAYVTGVTEKDVKDIYMIRSLLEGLCARWATEYITKEQLEELKVCLKSYQENLQIVGRFSLDTLEKDEDWLINEMNGNMPDVVISNISSPQRESFFENNHMKMNARIWLMLKDKVVHTTHRKDILWRVGDLLAKKLFRRKVEQYQKQD